ncbi:MAG: C-GCAxxG-C-C family protein [Defluviitaleaceae bacterium]|nr:C-GCAxxG-C-C family protein [Defluviitaleaceae bacterium]
MKVPDNSDKLLKGVSKGFGAGHICAALVSSIMALGLVCPLEEVNSLRIEFLERFYDEYKSLACIDLRNTAECENIVAKCAEILEEVIDKRLGL